MTNHEKKTQHKLWLAHVLLALFAVILVGSLALDVSSLWARLRDNDSDDYETHVMYSMPDGDVVETVARDVRQDRAGKTVQIYLDDSTVTVPTNDFVVYRDKPGRLDRYHEALSEIMIAMPDGSTEIVTGYAWMPDRGFTNPGKYLLTNPFYLIETAEREYYCSGDNLFVQELN